MLDKLVDHTYRATELDFFSTTPEEHWREYQGLRDCVAEKGLTSLCWVCVTSPSLHRRRGRDEQQTPPGNSPMNIDRYQMLKIKSLQAYTDAKLFNHTAEANIHSSNYMFIIIPYTIDIIAEID